MLPAAATRPVLPLWPGDMVRTRKRRRLGVVTAVARSMNGLTFRVAWFPAAARRPTWLPARYLEHVGWRMPGDQ